MSQTRASIPYVTAFTPQENSNVSPNGSMSKLTILQPFGVNPDTLCWQQRQDLRSGQNS